MPAKLSDRPGYIGRVDSGSHIGEPDSECGKGGGIEFNPHCRERCPANDHLADAVDLHELLRHDARSGIVNLLRPLAIGGEGQYDDRRIGRINFSVSRIVQQGAWQVCPGRIDGGLNIPRRAVDVPAEVELQGDAGLIRDDLSTVISVTPEIRPSLFSRGAATEAAMISGLAPGIEAQRKWWESRPVAAERPVGFSALQSRPGSGRRSGARWQSVS